MVVLKFSLLALSLLPATWAASIPHTSGHEHHSHEVNARLPAATWYHKRDHPAHQLFRRGENDDGSDYPEVGSPTWTAAYPKFTPDVKDTPKAWTDALKAAIDAGKIPNVPQTTGTDNPAYPAGTDAFSKEVCSSYVKCKSDDVVWSAPDGYFGTGFDDGPQPSSSKLYEMLAQTNTSSTHFMIGVYILQNPKIFQQAFEDLGGDIAVHTYTHPHMTTLSNDDVLAQLGWTMQIIHDSTGGRLPRYWRPPYGDSDTRVRAIAREVFGLETIMWSETTEDWSLTTGGTTLEIIHASMTKWLTGPKSPGLIVLEHEHSEQAVQSFLDAFPLMQQNQWKMMSVAQLADGNTDAPEDTNVYQNADGPTGSVDNEDVAGSAPTSASPSISSSAQGSVITKPSGTGTHSAGEVTSSPSTTSESSHNGAAAILGSRISLVVPVFAGLFSLI